MTSCRSNSPSAVDLLSDNPRLYGVRGQQETPRADPPCVQAALKLQGPHKDKGRPGKNQRLTSYLPANNQLYPKQELMKRLMRENRCFFCQEQGHRKAHSPKARKEDKGGAGDHRKKRLWKGKENRPPKKSVYFTP